MRKNGATTLARLEPYLTAQATFPKNLEAKINAQKFEINTRMI